ncbi:YraN family protein [Patescibacteria group bacterium]|nr:YraN family protein [Patescibacteria group bacterium]
MKLLPQQPHKSNRNDLVLGSRGEDIAADYLSKKQYRILARNFKARYGELDIIALAPSAPLRAARIFRKPSSNTVLVFVEVKTRIGRQYGFPEEAVTPRKLSEVIRTAGYYTALHPELPESQRIDVIAIELSADYTVLALRHIENVTG